MGWPRKNEQARVYQDDRGTYMMVFIPSEEDRRTIPFYADMLEGLFETMTDNDPNCPMLCSGAVGLKYLRGRKRVSFDEIPTVWQEAFKKRIETDREINVENFPGLWRK